MKHAIKRLLILVNCKLRLRQALCSYKTYDTRQHQQQGNMSCLPDDHHCNLDVSGGSEEQREETVSGCHSELCFVWILQILKDSMVWRR